MTELLLV